MAKLIPIGSIVELNKGTPHDNAVAEVGFKMIKIEFVHGEVFNTIQELRLELFDYVNWYKNPRLHSFLGYSTLTLFGRRTYIFYFKKC